MNSEDIALAWQYCDIAVEIMVKSYMELIGIFRGKQKTHNIQILSILYDNGPLTAWEITGKIQNIGKISLHATLNKRLRSLQKKEYLTKAGKKWCLHFKGIIAAILIQKKPKPLSSKWTEVIDFYSKYLKKHFNELSDTTIHVYGITYRPFEGLEKTVQTLSTFDDWIALSNFVRGLINTGVVNLDVISNDMLFNVIISEISRVATDEQIADFMKDWKFQINDKGKTDG